MKNFSVYFSAGIVFAITLSGCASFDFPAPPKETASPAQVPHAQVPHAQVPHEISDNTANTPAQDEADIAALTRPDPGLSVMEEPPETLSVIRPAPRQTHQEPVFEDAWERLRHGFRMGNLENDQATLRRFEKWYNKRPQYFTRIAERAYWFLPYVLEQVEKRGMPTEVAILPAIESAFRPDATSRSRAVGMWQFIGATGRRFGLRQDWWVDARRDLIQSTRAALDYLDYLSGEFNGDWELVFAAYNAGEGAIRRAMKKNLRKNRPSNYSHLSLSRETSEYVPKLLAVRNIIDHPSRYGVNLPHIPNHSTLKIIDAKTQTDLAVVASLGAVSTEQLRFFNSGYKRGVTPPSGPHKLVVPADLADHLEAELGKLSYTQRLRWARHQVRKGEYLGKIARNHNVSVDSIKKVNRLSSNLIRPGQELRIPLSTGYYKHPKITFINIKPQSGDTVYVVKSGDSLWKISQLSGASLSKLMNWNGMSKHTLLYPGQRLIVAR